MKFEEDSSHEDTLVEDLAKTLGELTRGTDQVRISTYGVPMELLVDPSVPLGLPVLIHRHT